jgi:hypothetical protein
VLGREGLKGIENRLSDPFAGEPVFDLGQLARGPLEIMGLQGWNMRRGS